MQTRKIGAHVSVSGGLYKAIERASKIGANCVQLFSGSPRVWKRKDLTEFNTLKLFSKQKELAVDPIFIHSLYLINLASNKPELLEKSFNALKYDLEFDSLVKGSGIIVHLGSHQGRGWESAREQVVQQIAGLLSVTPRDSTFLIENSAGQNGKLCSNLEEIRWLMDRVFELGGEKSNFLMNMFKKRLGWCFDTCHAHAAGYALGENRNFRVETEKTHIILKNSFMKKTALEEITALKLWSTLKCIHVNDSKDDFNSGRDRHANLGEGNIPTEDFIYFLNYKKILKIPLLLEVPGLDKNGPDAHNIAILKDYCK
ncbi:deoxyribonuclease IV [Patescibacteria group bacterium]|nr:deoxyribonuclease IV [Patescibacteria group bacterium]